MATTADRDAALDDAAGRRLGRVVLVAVAALVLLTGGVGTPLYLDSRYGPIQSSFFGGVYSQRGFVFSTDGSSYRLASAPGATAQVIAGLDNHGTHSVKITSIETGDMVSDIRWSVYRLVAGGHITGEPTPWRTFPAIVPAHGTIRLLITLHRPSNCNVYPKFDGVSEARYRGDHRVHWESLLGSHKAFVDVLIVQDEGIPVC
jgi:hypothetical protein